MELENRGGGSALLFDASDDTPAVVVEETGACTIVELHGENLTRGHEAAAHQRGPDSSRRALLARRP